MKGKGKYVHSPLFWRGWSDETDVRRQEEISILLGVTVNPLSKIEAVCAEDEWEEPKPA